MSDALEITLPIPTRLDAAERAVILATLNFFAGNKERTAATLGVAVRTIYNRLDEYQRQDFDARKRAAA